MRTLEENF